VGDWGSNHSYRLAVVPFKKCWLAAVRTSGILLQPWYNAVAVEGVLAGELHLLDLVGMLVANSARVSRARPTDTPRGSCIARLHLHECSKCRLIRLFGDTTLWSLLLLLLMLLLSLQLLLEIANS